METKKEHKSYKGISCPRCGSYNYRRTYLPLFDEDNSEYRCMDCGHEFMLYSVEPRKVS